MLELVSHPLCPYVQRAAIALREKNVAFTRTDVDLADKPAWFLALSPLGKTPLLRVAPDAVIFESAVICEYLEETASGPPLHPTDPLQRAWNRGWVEFSSALLNDIAGLYNAPDAEAFRRKRSDIDGRLLRIEAALDAGPWFAGPQFSLVDAAFAPAFRYFDALAPLWDVDPFAPAPKTQRWRQALAARPSVIDAVSRDYPERLVDFLIRRNSFVSRQLAV